MEMTILFIAVVFVIAGAVKGAIGLGLPPITMGLLVMVMPPVEAAALTVAPAFVTNVWQMVDGPHLRRLVRRLWPLMLCAVAGTLAGAGWLRRKTPGPALQFSVRFWLSTPSAVWCPCNIRLASARKNGSARSPAD